MDQNIKSILKILRQWCCPMIPMDITKESCVPLPPKRQPYPNIMTSASQQVESGIRYGLLDISHLDTVVAFLIGEFFAKEPAGTSIGVNPEQEIKPWLRTLIEFQLKLQLSIGAWDSATNELVGVSVNETDIADAPHPVTLYELVTPQFHNMYQITEIMRDLHGDRDLFKTYQVKVFGHVSMLGVKTDYGGRGIATKLVEKSEQAFLEQQITAVFVETTSEFSAGAFRRMGYEVIAELPYSDFKRKGEVVFNNTGVHKVCRVFIKRLSGPN